MGGNQTVTGKAFEYACLKALYDFLSGQQDVSIIDTPQLHTAKNAYDSGEIEATELDSAAMASVRMIVMLEPKLKDPDGDTPLFLTLQPDSAGVAGDVRDVLCIRSNSGWEIGLSCKHNHEAVKHSRISPVLDFGKSWFGIPCHKEYFDEITPVFDMIRRHKKESNGTFLWDDLDDKFGDVYIPLLSAFAKEVQRLYDENGSVVPERLVRYLIGRNDFYKVITNDSKRYVKIEAINLNGTLNIKSNETKPLNNVPKLQLPTQIYHIGFEKDSNNTVDIVCDCGWAMSFRIHSAKSAIEASLKFDIRLISMPANIYSYTEPYDIP